MSDIAIRIENLGKRYRYGGVAPLSANLRSDLTDWMKGIFSPQRTPRNTETVVRGTPAANNSVSSSSETSVNSVVKSPSRPSFHEIHEEHLAHDPQYFWALKDINLEVRHGEVVGIIGRNGAGKSTLLKVLSRITAPTTGKITYHGRIASLLEVGTGFHRELTGRENIFLNGSILGMRRAEIARKLDEIIAFAEIEKFLDTPVKFYSSGMYVRLAFAVAAHLEPEILVVDEVLAVGDAEFQKKCLGKMSEVAKGGRTVLFVSHNMTAISNLCARCALLERGSIAADATPTEVIGRYLGTLGTAQGSCVSLTDWPTRCGIGIVGQLARIQLFNADGIPSEVISMGNGVRIEIDVKFFRTVKEPEVGVVISTPLGQRVVRFLSTWEGIQGPVTQGNYRYQICIPNLMIVPGPYTLTPFLRQRRAEYEDLIESALQFHVAEADITGHAPDTKTCRPGEAFARSQWEVTRLQDE
ncbi:MAG: ABC transporter ATP-binding protein [Verrucomicrobia bacterium]|nr:ABC transporter ATP-binding protein [Verrucomicrobiota bacterium]